MSSFFLAFGNSRVLISSSRHVVAVIGFHFSLGRHFSVAKSYSISPSFSNNESSYVTHCRGTLSLTATSRVIEASFFSSFKTAAFKLFTNIFPIPLHLFSLIPLEDLGYDLVAVALDLQARAQSLKTHPMSYVTHL